MIKNDKPYIIFEKDFYFIKENYRFFQMQPEKNYLSVYAKDDHSYYIFHINNEYIVYPCAIQAYQKYVSDALKKNPNYAKLLNNYIKKCNEEVHFPIIWIIVSDIKYLIEYNIPNAFNTFKKLTDNNNNIGMLLASLGKFKAKSKFKRILYKCFYPNKKHLLNKKNIYKIKNIYYFNLPQYLKYNHFNINTADELSDFIDNVQNNYFDKSFIENYCNHKNITYFKFEDYLIVNCNQHKLIAPLIPRIWCILEKEDFLTYNNTGYFFIIYTFKNVTSTTECIGVTVSKHGIIYHSFDETNKKISIDDNIRLKLIEKVHEMVV